MRTDRWETKCVSCGEMFIQSRTRSGRRAIMCNKRICFGRHRWRKSNPGKIPSAQLEHFWRAYYGDTLQAERVKSERKRQEYKEAPVVEYRRFLKEQHAIWVQRVRYVAADNRDLTWELLGERFGVDAGVIGRVCRDIPRERDMLAANWNKERRSA